MEYHDVKSIGKDCERELHLDRLCTDINIIFSEFCRKLEDIKDRHAPEKTVMIKDRPKRFWFNDEIKTHRKIVQSRFKIFKKYKCDHQWKAYKVERNKLNRIIKKPKSRN